MTGKIDLTYRVDGKVYVVDYKSNRLPAYDAEALSHAMSASEYDLQALLYAVAVHRWLRMRLGATYDPAAHFGGVRYLFCRGLEGRSRHRCTGVPPSLIDAVDALLGGTRGSNEHLAPHAGRRAARLRPCVRRDLATPGPGDRPARARCRRARIVRHRAKATQRSTSPTRKTPASLRDALRASRWIATPLPMRPADPALPLVLEGDLLFLRRYREYERRLAQGLRRIAIGRGCHRPRGSTMHGSTRCSRPRTRDPHQARAATLALQPSVARHHRRPRHRQDHDHRATVAAVGAHSAQRRTARCASRSRHRPDAPPNAWPKACAARSMRCASPASTMPCAMHCRAMRRPAPPARHRSGSPALPPRRRSPLAFDLVVVDEASMVDLPLMCKLVEAIPDGARLVLLGDRDQLPSVEAGDVLAAIADARRRPVESDAARHRPKAHLRRHPRRVATCLPPIERLDLAPLAAAVRDGDADTALALCAAANCAACTSTKTPPIRSRPHARSTARAVARTRQRRCRQSGEGAALEAIAQALALAGRSRLLTALRNGRKARSR
jgi:hypothetical protein